ncbi:MAG: PQQ-binding-like beta-propeller repeat protein [Myxococcaceae bacterium]
MRWTVPLLLLALVNVAACDRAGVRPISGSILVRPGSVAFGDVVVGVRAKRTVVVSNGTKARERLSLRTEAPFELWTDVVEVPGGGSVEVELTFAPSRLGSARSALQLVRGGEVLVEVKVSGSGVGVPSCPAPEPCQTSEFSWELGECVVQVRPDGETCNAPCLLNATCEDGLCRGEEVSCDDGNACTIDACDADGSCVNPPLECADDGDPCTAEWCDPLVGCAARSLDEGTACGDGKTCQKGGCLWTPLTPQQVCALDTPCQAPGTWTGTTCERPAPKPLQPAWRYTLPPDSTGESLVMDAQENLYWLERHRTTPPRQELVSVDRDGNPRFRAPIESTWAPWTMVVGDTLYLVEKTGSSPSAIVARSAVDGSVLWSKSVAADLGLSTGSPYYQYLRAAGPDRIFFSVMERQGEPVHVVALDVATQMVAWYRTFGDAAVLDHVDEAGRLFVDDYNELVALDFTGAELWRTRHRPYQRDPVYGGFLFQEDGRLLDASDGRVAFELPVGSVARFLVPGAAVMLSGDSLIAPPTRVFTQPLRGGPWTSAVPSDGLPFNAASDVVLTGRGGLLFAGDDRAGGFALREVHTTGEVLFECPLPYVPPPCCEGDPRHRYGDSQILMRDRWIAAGRMGSDFLIAFDIPGAQPPEHGWYGGLRDGTGQPK